MINLDLKYKNLLETLKQEAPFVPDIAIVLGSGLGDFAKSINVVKSLKTSSLSDYPKSTVEGHEGYLHFCTYKDKNVLLFQGRIHFYEGYKLSECILPAYITFKLKCKKLLLTNAAGGINPNFQVGDLMIITSMNSSNLWKELTELIKVPSIEQKNNFFNFPSKNILSKIKEASLTEKVMLKEGVYWFNKGPIYETPAEINMFAKLGNDAVGMSTVHEALFAAMQGVEVAGISCITNMAAGITGEKLSHKEVMETAELVKDKFERLVKKIIELI